MHFLHCPRRDCPVRSAPCRRAMPFVRVTGFVDIITQIIQELYYESLLFEICGRSEKTGSITKAAQNFYMNQPHLSKIIRELERDLGCDIFDRTSRGMVPTKKGEEFLRYAKAILVQEEQIEALCVKNSEKALEVNLCVPRATYISYAFSDFLKHMDSCPSVNVHYMETNSRDTIRGVSGKTFDVGIIRCQALYESYYMKLLQDENLEWKELWQFSCNVLMSPSHPLASRNKLTYLDFTDYIEIVQGDIQNPSFTFEASWASKVKEGFWMSPWTISM